MARTARRYEKRTEKKSYQIPVCMAAIYARLSVDTDERKSESIETQVTLIKEFVDRHNAEANKEYELVVYDIYSDLGKTGTNFERAGFERMMDDVRAGKVNCILVKDFSRFGRNYIETGNYLEKILPFMKVRFISVCDHYDSFAPNAKNQELSMNIKNLVNDAYAKDISAKERAAKRTAQKNGEYVGATAPYGYCCEKINGIYKLVKEPESAKIVQRIFAEYASGKEIQQIIDGLFEDSVHRISDYNHYHVLDESQWIVTPNAHEPIISRELFEKVQIRLKVAQEARSTVVGWEDDERAFYNVFYCGDCKRKMCTRRSRGSVFYFCNAAQYRDERKCSHKSISENTVQKIVCSELTRQMQLAGFKKKDMSAMSNDIFSAKILEIQNEIKKLDAEVEQRSEKLAQTFMQYKDEKLSRETYMEMREERNNWKIFCEERKETLEQMIRRLQKQQKEETRFLRNLLDLEGTTKINAELAKALIENMYLYGDGRLEINFRFKGAIEHE